jgi:hypothetical protein
MIILGIIVRPPTCGAVNCVTIFWAVFHNALFGSMAH